MSVPARMTPSSKASWAASVPSAVRAAGGGAGFGGEQVAPLLLDAGYFVVDAACLRAYLGGRRDEEAPAGEDPPLDVGQVALTQREQALPAGLGRAEGWCDDFGDEAVPGCVDGRQLELFLGAEQGVHAALGQAGRAGEPADGQASRPSIVASFAACSTMRAGRAPRVPGSAWARGWPGRSSLFLFLRP